MKKQKVHFMGIGGSGMSAVAQLAHHQGYIVSGCDLQESTPYIDKLKKLHVTVAVGHNKSHVKDVDILAVNAAAYFQDEIHPEFKEGEKQGKLMRWQEFLGKYLQKNKKVICIAGTHGKSTTTTMTSLLLEAAGLDPSAMIGATVKEWGTNYRAGEGDVFITESDEFFDNFLYYRPDILLLNNIEFDHPDYFRSQKQLYQSFKKHVLNLTGSKTLIINQDSPGINKLIKQLPKTFLKQISLIGYTITNKPLTKTPTSFKGKITKETTSSTHFSVKSSDNKFSGNFSLSVPGKYNISNALGVIILSYLNNIDQKIIRKSLKSYSGVGRRLELLGKPKGIPVYDDYGHHPTAVKVTLQALRQKYPKNKIFAVCEPHSYSRTKALLSNYAHAFDQANEVIITPIFPARDTENFGVSKESIVKVAKHKHIRALPDFDTIVDYLIKKAKRGNVIIVFGAGKSYYLSRQIVAALSK